MSEYNSFKVLQVECPKCGAAAGVDCVTRHGNKASDTHTARKAVVYPQFGRNLSGGAKQAVASPVSARAKLRKAVMEAAITWSGCGAPYPPEQEPERSKALFEACQALLLHRKQHPEVRG